MGLGDDLMAAGDAVRLQARDPRPVCVVDRRGRPRWHPLWDGNPRLTQTPEGAQRLVNASGFRPYIDRDRSSPSRWAFRPDYRATPAELYLTDAEREAVTDFPAGAIIVEPFTKPGASPNKDWGWSRWQRLVDLLRATPGCPAIAQIGPVERRLLSGASWYRTPGFRLACAALARASLAILPEGGLHHAAAALGVPAVVLFGGYISPETTGYPLHRNIFTGDHRTIGWRVSHTLARRAMDAITPEEVHRHAAAILGL